jgi:tight adherence protein B
MIPFSFTSFGLSPFAIAGFVFGAAILFAVTVFLVITAGAKSPARQIKRRLSGISIGDLSQAREEAEERLGGKLTSVEQFIQRFRVGRYIALLLDQVNLPYLPGQFFLLSFFLGLVGLCGGALLSMREEFLFQRGVVLSLLLALFLGFIPYLVLLDRRRIRIKRFTEQFPDTLEMLARSLRAGHGLNVAIQMVSQEMPDPVRSVFKRSADEQVLGLSLQVVMEKMALRIPTMDVEFFASAVVIQRETGGNLAEIMDKLGHIIRERFRLLGQIRIFTAQGRMTGYILSVLPIAGGLLFYLLNPDYIMLLFKDQLGQLMILAALALQIVGIFVIRRIVDVKV